MITAFDIDKLSDMEIAHKIHEHRHNAELGKVFEAEAIRRMDAAAKNARRSLSDRVVAWFKRGWRKMKETEMRIGITIAIGVMITIYGMAEAFAANDGIGRFQLMGTAPIVVIDTVTGQLWRADGKADKYFMSRICYRGRSGFLWATPYERDFIKSLDEKKLSTRCGKQF